MVYPMNIGYLLTLNANRYPNKIALTYKDSSISYRELNYRVNRLANSLMEVGIRKGDRVGYLFPNCNEIVELFFALMKIGAVAVPLNHRLIAKEIKYLLDLAECKALVYSDKYWEKVKEFKHNLKAVSIFIRSGEEGTFGEHSFQQLRDNGPGFEPNVSVGGEDLARIQFTGGTTGRSKGVMRTHRSDVFQTIGIMCQNKMGANPDAVVLTQSPLNHQAALSWLLSTVAAGAQFVVCDKFDPVEILHQVAIHRVTYLMLLPPSTYLRLLDIPNLRDFDLSSVKLVQMSAGCVSREIILKTYEAFPNCEVNYGWGQTETGAGTGQVITREMALNNLERMQSIGKAMPFIELRIVDEQGNEVQPGAVGECIARGPAIMSGYYNEPELTNRTLKDGWVHTGDMFRQDEEGYYYFVGRKKDMIKSGGENVYAQEVEEVIRTHPAVEECAVIGVPDRRFGEAVMVVIKLRRGCAVTAEEIQEHCKSQMASYKKPRYVEFIDSFPVDMAGKIQKYKLKEMFQNKYDAS